MPHSQSYLVSPRRGRVEASPPPPRTYLGRGGSPPLGAMQQLLADLTMDETLPQDEGSSGRLSPHPPTESIGPAQRAVLEKLSGGGGGGGGAVSEDGSTMYRSVTRSIRTLSPCRYHKAGSRSGTPNHSRCCQAAREDSHRMRQLMASLRAEADTLRTSLAIAQNDQAAVLSELDKANLVNRRLAAEATSAAAAAAKATSTAKAAVAAAAVEKRVEEEVEVEVEVVEKEVSHKDTMTEGNPEKETELRAQLEIELTHSQEYAVLLEQRTEDLQMKVRKLEQSKDELEDDLLQDHEERERRIRHECETELRASAEMNDSETETARKIQDTLKEKLHETQNTLIQQSSELADLQAASRRDTAEHEAHIRDLEQQLSDAHTAHETRITSVTEQLAETITKCEEAEDATIVLQTRLDQERLAWGSERDKLNEKVIGLEVSRSELTTLLNRIRADNDKLKAENDYIQAQFQMSLQQQQQQQHHSPHHSHSSADGDGARQGAMGLDLDANTLTVTRVVPGGPSFNAGIKKSDVVVAIQTESDMYPIPVECVHVLRNSLSISGGVADGSTIFITVLRKGQRRTFPLTLVRDDGSVAQTMMRHLKELKVEHRSLNIKLTVKLATSESALQDALRKVLPMPPDRVISYDVLVDCLATFNASLGLPVYTSNSVSELYHSCTPGNVTLQDLFAGLKELFYSSLRGLELGE